MSWAFHEAPTTRKGDLLVLLVLADHAHDDGGGAYPSVRTIADLARMSERGVQTALGHLRAAGIITVDGRTATGTRIYRILSTPAVVAPRSHCTPPQPLRGGVQPDVVTPATAAPEPLEPSLNQKKGRPSNYDDAVIG
jgi:hypothetical protein